MEIIKNPLFWCGIIIACLLILRTAQKPPTVIEPCHFSINDIGYGFKVNLICKEQGKFLVEYMPKLQRGAEYRCSSCWHKIDGVPIEVLTPGAMFLPLRDGDGLKFQRVVVATSRMNEFGGVERTYNYLEEYYKLPAEYLQSDSGYVYTWPDYALKNF